MTKAEKMLEDLGYVKVQESKRYIRYTKNYGLDGRINIDKTDKLVKKDRITPAGTGQPKYVTVEELKAIYEYYKENNWL